MPNEYVKNHCSSCLNMFRYVSILPQYVSILAQYVSILPQYVSRRLPLGAAGALSAVHVVAAPDPQVVNVVRHRAIQALLEYSFFSFFRARV